MRVWSMNIMIPRIFLSSFPRGGAGDEARPLQPCFFSFSHKWLCDILWLLSLFSSFCLEGIYCLWATLSGHFLLWRLELPGYWMPRNSLHHLLRQLRNHHRIQDHRRAILPLHLTQIYCSQGGMDWPMIFLIFIFIILFFAFFEVFFAYSFRFLWAS